MSIPFTQFLRPDGRTKDVDIDRPRDVEAKAQAVVDAGLFFEAEVLATGHVSLTVADREAEEDIAIEVVANGPDVLPAVDRLVETAWQLRAAPQAQSTEEAGGP